MTDDQIMALIRTTLGLFCGIAWAGFGVAGWIIPKPDSARRFTWRYLAWGAMGAYWITQCLGVEWWRLILNTVLFVYASTRIEHWWKAAERLRRIEP